MTSRSEVERELRFLKSMYLDDLRALAVASALKEYKTADVAANLMAEDRKKMDKLLASLEDDEEPA